MAIKDVGNFIRLIQKKQRRSTDRKSRGFASRQRPYLKRFLFPFLRPNRRVILSDNKGPDQRPAKQLVLPLCIEGMIVHHQVLLVQNDPELVAGLNRGKSLFSCHCKWEI